uniref:Uncharacterized protein n=1 Tax=Lotharella globosa TaxID=91324 RepID=A0A6V3JST6_9EUKA
MNWSDQLNSSVMDILNLDALVSLASLGVSLFTVDQERRHHAEAKKLELKHHKFMVEMEKRLHDEQIALDQKSVDADKRRHNESVRLSNNLHKQAVHLEHTLHQAQLYSALEQHLQDITSDLIVAGKEADRDMWDQRNAQFQTLLLSATVMFAAGMAVIVEGELPQDTGNVLIVGYSASVGMSFAFLFVSIILCIRIVVSMSDFMYHLTNHHQGVVSGLVQKATGVMNDVIAIQEGGEYVPFTSREQNKESEEKVAPGEKRPSFLKHQKASYEKKLNELREKKAEINSYLANQYLNRRLGAADRIQRKKMHKKSMRKGESQQTTMRREGDEKFGRVSTMSMTTKRHLSRQNSNYSIHTSETDVPSMTEFEAFWQRNLRFPAKSVLYAHGFQVRRHFVKAFFLFCVTNTLVSLPL